MCNTTTLAVPHETAARRPNLAALHDQFVTRIMPAVERHARVYFRHLRCPHAKQDAVADATALAWRWFVRLTERGKDTAQFPSAIAAFAARAVNAGRRVCGQEKPRDVLSRIAQKRHGFAVETFPNRSTLAASPLMEALRDNTQAPVDEQVCFRIDFPEWLATLGARDRQIVTDMAMGDRTHELAERYRVSEARISQLRRTAHDEWDRYERDGLFGGKPHRVCSVARSDASHAVGRSQRRRARSEAGAQGREHRRRQRRRRSAA
jgi:hypothetical protein